MVTPPLRLQLFNQPATSHVAHNIDWTAGLDIQSGPLNIRQEC